MRVFACAQRLHSRPQRPRCRVQSVIDGLVDCATVYHGCWQTLKSEWPSQVHHISSLQLSNCVRTMTLQVRCLSLRLSDWRASSCTSFTISSAFRLVCCS